MKVLKEMDKGKKIGLAIAGVLLIIALMFLFLWIRSSNKADFETQKELDLSYEFDGMIPTISVKGENIPVGIELPDAENDWGDTFYDGENPLFLLTISPDYWDKVFEVELLGRIIVKIGNYFYYITPMGPVSPVWAFSYYYDLGQLYGLTNHNCFLFMHHGKLEVVKQGYVYYPEVHEYDELPFEETISIWKTHPVDVSSYETICIDSLENNGETIVEVSERLGVIVVCNAAHGPFSTIDTVPIYDGSFYTVDGKNGKRMIRFQAGLNSPYEMIFAGAIDNLGMTFRIPLALDVFNHIDKYGIHYYRGDEEYVAPFAPIIIDDEFYYGEWNEEFFQYIKYFFPADQNGVESNIYSGYPEMETF